MVFTNESSRIITIALSTYHKSQYFTLSEWFEAKEMIRNNVDLAKKLKELNRKSATEFGVI